MVAARRGIGIRDPDFEHISSALQHRFHLARVSAVMKGGVRMASLYLEFGVGLNEANLAILQEVATVLCALGAPWILAGDFNSTPEQLEATNFLQLVRGVVIAPAPPTCNGKVFDDFIVSDSLRHAVAGIARIDDAGLHPHFPVRLFVRGDARRHMVRTLVRPPCVPGLLPHGPLPRGPPLEHLKPTEVSIEAVDAAAARWNSAARAEWASLFGEVPSSAEPRFAWRPAVGRVTPQVPGSTDESEYYRNFACRVTEIAALLDRARPSSMHLMASHFAKLSGTLAVANLDQWNDADARGLLNAAIATAQAGRATDLRRAAATARKRAHTIEQRQANRRLVHWKNSLVVGEPSGPTATHAPSRKAFQWVRGFCGWQKSPVGPAELDDEVPAEDDDLAGHLAEHAAALPRVIKHVPGQTLVPLCDQADVNQEGDTWAKLWDEGKQYEASCCPDAAARLPALLPPLLRASCRSFPVGTGKGPTTLRPVLWRGSPTPCSPAWQPCCLPLSFQVPGPPPPGSC